MRDKSWDFYDKIEYAVLTFCQSLLGHDCHDEDCKSQLMNGQTYNSWLVSMKGLSSSKEANAEDAVLNYLMGILNNKKNVGDGLVFQRCMLYEKRCSEMKVKGKDDAKRLVGFILKYAPQSNLPVAKEPLNELGSLVSLWISLNEDLKDCRDEMLGGASVLISDNTLEKLSKAKEDIHDRIFKMILSSQESEEKQILCIKGLFGEDAVKNIPQIIKQNEEAQKKLLTNLWNIYRNPETSRPSVRPKGRTPIKSEFVFSVIAFYIWYDKFRPNRVNYEQFYQWLGENNRSFNWNSAYKSMRGHYFYPLSLITNKNSLEEAQKIVEENKKDKPNDIDYKRLLDQIEVYLKLKNEYLEDLKSLEHR